MVVRAKKTFAAIVLGVLFGAASGYAQDAPRGTAPEARPARRIATARRTTQPPKIDGAMDDAAWADAPALTDLVQAEPFEGQPATERTEIRLLYDDKFLYIGVTCFDSEPSQIVTSDARRDADLGSMDSFQMILDTFHDRQNGFVFGTNAAGSQYDAQIRSEGETQSNGPPGLSGATAGAGAGVNVNWDGSWDVKSSVNDSGWTAEFQIPFRTLRYGGPPQTWGINFQRNIRRKREQVYWSPVSRAYNLFRLSSAGDLVGLNVNPPRNFKVSPYAISNANRGYALGKKSSSDVNNDWGIDAKYGVTPSMNLDLTYNTDFAQVEADQQQINLTRFNLVFPEKRPFFLENAGLFAVGKPGEVDLFYSRRIGISAAGDLVPIRGGGRLSGKVAGVNVGLVNMQTDSVSNTPANNFTAARINRELPNRSSLGLMFTNRTATGNGVSGNWNRAYAFDGKLGIGEGLTLKGWAAQSQTPGVSGNQHAVSGGIEYNTKQRRDFFEFNEVGAGFNPEVGFLQRLGGYRQLWTGWYEHLRSKKLRDAGFREFYPHMTYQRYWKFNGDLQSATLHLDNHLDWENGLYWSPAVNVDWDQLDKPFTVYPGVVVPVGRYRAVHTAWQANTDKKKFIWVNIGYQVGGFLSGHQNSMAPGLSIRSGSSLITSLTWTRNDISLPQGDFVTNLGAFRVVYNVSTSVNVQSLIQYNDRTSRWSTNMRLSWLNTASTGLFVVYNDTEALEGVGPVNRSFIIKYSRQFDILR